MSYDKYAAWNNVYANNNPIAYPPEGLIRIFLGEFPKLNFPHDFKSKSICDVGFGDGRNFPLFDRLGLRVSGVEITQDIVHAALTRDMFKNMNLDLRVGECSSLPYQDSSFDYVVSWNSSYYMSDSSVSYAVHADELMRVVKPNGYLILSVPKPTAFIYDNCIEQGNGNVLIQRDYFGQRVGQIFARFATAKEFEAHFQKSAQYISSAHIDIAWFGLNYHWYVTVVKKIASTDTK